MEEGKTFVSWEEVVVSNDKGRREVHYYLRDAGGGADLAVVGKERSIRHMSYAVPGRFLRSLLVKPPHLPTSPSSSSSSPSAVVSLKWKTRREVVDWLSSLVSDSISHGSSPIMDRFTDDEGAEPTEIPTSKGLSSGKMGHHSKEFSWLGSAWNCKKRRMHYRSFCRNGVSISVHDFVYVMAEENKRLIAYVEDLYEDPRANNMVVVRWFHKVDEVGILLPADVNAREIFFSLCLQDLSVECIDGLAAVLSAQHFEKFLKESKQSIWEPYLCRRQIDNDYIKPLDITQVQGYWSQELLRSLYSPSLKLRFKISCAGNESSRVTQVAPKINHLLINENMDVGGTTSRDMNKAKHLGFGSSKAEKHVANTTMAFPLLRKELFKQKLRLWPLAPGCQVEVLSQDSGMRGCWFRCVVLKRQRDKVKVRYQNVQDADEAGNLEEWLVSSRVASPDNWGIRLRERPILRPSPSSRGTDCFDVGAVVDAWWHDGWWEGLVIRKESEEKLHVYFPGEQQVSIFGQSDLRHSQDWVGNTWNAIKDRPDIASSLTSISDGKNQGLLSDGCITQQAPASVPQPDTDPRKESSPHGAEDVCKLTPEEKPLVESGGDVLKLAKVCQFDLVNWSSLRRKGSSLKRKKKRGSELSSKYGSSHKRPSDGSSSSSSSQEEAEESNGCGDFVLPKSLTVDHENCKIGGDHPLFGAPMTLCSNLVMSM